MGYFIQLEPKSLPGPMLERARVALSPPLFGNLMGLFIVYFENKVSYQPGQKISLLEFQNANMGAMVITLMLPLSILKIACEIGSISVVEIGKSFF